MELKVKAIWWNAILILIKKKYEKRKNDKELLNLLIGNNLIRNNKS